MSAFSFCFSHISIPIQLCRINIIPDVYYHCILLVYFCSFQCILPGWKILHYSTWHFLKMNKQVGGLSVLSTTHCYKIWTNTQKKGVQSMEKIKNLSYPVGIFMPSAIFYEWAYTCLNHAWYRIYIFLLSLFHQCARLAQCKQCTF